jgi:hypothetical protein
MGTTDHRKKQQLGMPFGTACNKLRKNIMFSLVQRVGWDICFKCGKKIDSVDEFTIEHKIPWLDNDSDLFWDLDNIAFSHAKCNKPDIHRRGRKIGPAGTSWCCSCQKFKHTDEFNKTATNWNGLDYECKKCKSDRVTNSEWYKKSRKGNQP